MSDARQALQGLLSSLGKSCKSSQFAASGSLLPISPGLHVDGVGSIDFPIKSADAKNLIAKSAQAPYGRGEETIVDTKVRRVWQIEPSEFSLQGPEWDETMSLIVSAVKREFGIKQKVTPHLYKLLIYEKGSFFAPHRDTEKTAGMFATLVVCLPSRHLGGSLIVRHDGQSKKIDFGGKQAESELQFAAFYADCEHEIKPVTDGHRVCLVYNLAIAGKKRAAAPENARAAETAAELLVELFADSSSELDKIAIPFQHQYTEAGLDPKQLKGADRACADVLVRAAKSLDYQCYLALLTHHQSGEAESWSGYHDRYRSRRSYRWYDDYDDDEDENDEDGDDSDAEMGEVYEEDMSLENWVDPQGRKQRLGKMNLEESEVLCKDDREGWSVRQEVHEATGNEGVSLERWYHQAVIVLWPRTRYFSILAHEGQESALPGLAKMAARNMKPADLAACREFARQIIDHWQAKRRHFGGDQSCSARMLNLLERIGDAELALRFVRDILPKDFGGTEGKSLLRLCKRFGWETFADALRSFFVQQAPKDYYARLEPVVSICESLCCAAPALTANRRAVCVSLADELTCVIERWDGRRTAAYFAPDKRTGVVASVVRIYAVVSVKGRLERFLTNALADKKRYDLHEALIPDVRAIFRWLPTVPAAQPAFDRLLQHCIAELRTATANPVVAPTDWKRDAKLGCKCADCRELSRFLRDPTRQVGHFPLSKQRRRHLHNQIDLHDCDLTHTTMRQGSPQTLVCTKTEASYERRRKQDDVDKKLLAELETLASDKRRVVVRRSPSRRAVKG